MAMRVLGILLLAVQCATAQREVLVHIRLIAARLVEQAKFAEMLRTLSLDSPGHWRGDIMQVYLNPNEQAERVIAIHKALWIAIPRRPCWRARLRWETASIFDCGLTQKHVEGRR